ncbi:F-box/kelch-repeat protein At3g16740 [Arabidopsis lyrata subsp. lyrata]|uniref:F-box/kelch-repeat protein At3g16740 n=1 Tax=Arabidopsis lyrata subsp. lyrata TaxID=81972 RepID=UPI000A29D533|nr:F-box/kelch-repeat protein At3g16740 [Arabidopsis lyrata subsp. lyrata]|eukprot:XP_020883674.1 F-box/kelch-repeat protein At3g16740 [Arabidopsis lyrata subsp. lyrata]
MGLEPITIKPKFKELISPKTRKRWWIDRHGKERFARLGLDPKMLDLPSDMEEEVLSRVPVTSLGKLRLTCKKWNTLTKGESFLKKNGIEVVMLVESRVSLMTVDLLYPSIERIGNLDADGIKISKIFHCQGLFLCINKDKDKDSSRLVVLNPFLGQTRYIELPRNSSYHIREKYALGYEKKNHKVLRFVNEYYEISGDRICELQMYSLNSNSWKVIDDFTPDWYISYQYSGVSLKGNTYWYAQDEIPFDGRISDHSNFLLSFDFTKERFGPRLPLPFHGFYRHNVTFSSVREEQLAVLFQSRYELDSVVKIWITNKIEPNAVSWSNLLFAVDMKPVAGFQFPYVAGSFFVDEDKKVAVVVDKEDKCHPHNIVYIIGDNGILNKVDLGESTDNKCFPLVCSYVPSSVQIPNTP